MGFFYFQNRIFRFIRDKYQQSHGKCFFLFKIVVESEEDVTPYYSLNIDFMIRLLLQILICISQIKIHKLKIFNQLVEYSFMSSRRVQFIPVFKHVLI